MSEHPDPTEAIAAHIRAATRPDAESRRLLRELLAETWPGGHHDRTEPLARGWLSLWGPQRTIIEIDRCECHDGRCGICG